MNQPADLVYTLTDEAPALATRSWLPVVQSILDVANVRVKISDISLAGRIVAAFPEAAGDDIDATDALANLGELVLQPHANIIKLPNISASIPQLQNAIAELRESGILVPPYPAQPKNDDENEIQRRYAKVLGSAVNPVLREGNSDRRVAEPVKKYAQAHPHSMGDWSSQSPTRVAHMNAGDFYGSERSHTFDSDTKLEILWISSSGDAVPLRQPLAVTTGEVVDAAVMSAEALRTFYEESIDQAANEDLLLSLHLKATMMKVSDPILFGHMVRAFYTPVFQQHRDALRDLGWNPNNGMSALEKRLDAAEYPSSSDIRQTIRETYDDRPPLAMVDSDRGITNLHVPSDVIIDASMPAAIRAGGQMWGPDGKLHPMLAVIPDRSYAGVYQAVIEFCKANGAFDVSKMGTVNNVGLMAKKAEEYGSHDKTFEIQGAGQIVVRTDDGETIFEFDVEKGDLFRMCQTKDVAIEDWVKLAVDRARQTGWPAVFWLDPQRGHDSELIAKVETYLKGHNTEGLDIQILSPVDATWHACRRAAAGENTIAVTGNVLRDYLTDLFPILELGTSAKMLSIVPLLSGGGLFETGAGGSAPKHVQQFVEEGHLRWDSLGEFLALKVSLDQLARHRNDPKIQVIADCLDRATDAFLTEDRSPKRRVGELDTRGSHFYMTLYWVEELAKQDDSPEIAAHSADAAERLRQQEATILDELASAQGCPVDLGGYYRPDEDKAASAMRPSDTWNSIISAL